MELPARVQEQIDAKIKGKNLVIAAELWLNKDTLPVQITTDQTALLQAIGAPGDGESKTMTKYTEWGVPVTVTAPPADQVGDLVELLKNARN